MSSQKLIDLLQDKINLYSEEVKTTSKNIKNEEITKNNIILAKETRNKLLSESDKYLLSDFPISEENLALVKDYRTCLRDYFGLDEVINYSYPDNFLPDLPKLNLVK